MNPTNLASRSLWIGFGYVFLYLPKNLIFLPRKIKNFEYNDVYFLSY